MKLGLTSIVIYVIMLTIMLRCSKYKERGNSLNIQEIDKQSKW